MIKTIKRILLGLLSTLFLSSACWAFVLFNPSVAYAYETHIDLVTVHHNTPLHSNANQIIQEAIDIIKKSDLYTEEFKIDLCMNDGSFYPELWIFKGGAAYAFMDKAVIYHSSADFENDRAHLKWAVNNYEERSFKLTRLLAHEFSHNLQSMIDRLHPLKVPFWKTEGHAEYTCLQWKDDGKLKEKIDFYKEEVQKEHPGIPVFLEENGTIQPLSYYQYGIAVQYLMDIEGLNWNQICSDERTLEDVQQVMFSWSES